MWTSSRGAWKRWSLFRTYKDELVDLSDWRSLTSNTFDWISVTI